MRLTLANIQQVNLPGIGMVHLQFGVASGAKHLVGFEKKYRCNSKRIGKAQAF